MIAGLDSAVKIGAEQVAERFPGYEIDHSAFKVKLVTSEVHVAMRLETGEALSVDIPFESLVAASCPWQKVASWMFTRVASFVAHEITTRDGGQA